MPGVLSGDKPSPLLPSLRQELRLLPGEPLSSGAPTWLLFDPVRNAYHRLERLAYERLSLWRGEPTDRYLQRANRLIDTPTDEDDLKELAQFLYAQKLVITPPDGDSEKFAAQEFAATPPLSHTILHKYLFFRIPLVRPDRFLAATYPYLRWIFTKTCIWTVAIAGLLGLFFAGRQWDVFVTTFLHFLTFEGLIYYGLTIAGLKIIHELGHAYTAHHFGSRVPVMGLAFLVMFPILYTDTTNAWELTDRRKRVLIDAGGMSAELMIACISLLLWSFLPDGPLRSAAFFTATTSWVFSLIVNLNPMMRFDGYYLLTDLFGVPNMQADGFEVGRWRMRETLFGLGNPPPGQMGSTRRFGLTIYAYATWVYRFFLFIGIAILVHALFAKALGILLFVVEIGWFIVKPIFKELKTWWSLRMDILKSKRGRMTCMLACLGLAALCLPWQTTVTAPALLRPAQETELFPVSAAKVMGIYAAEGQMIKAGDIIAVLDSDVIDMEIETATQNLNLIIAQLSRRSADRQDLSSSAVLFQAKARELKRLQGLHDLRRSLTIRAPHDGIVTDMPRDLHAGRYVQREFRIARIMNPQSYEILAFPKDDQASRLSDKSESVFIADNVLARKMSAKISELAPTSETLLMEDTLSSQFKGPIAVAENKDGQAVPETAIFRVSAMPEHLPDTPRAVRGVLKIKAKGQSPASAIFKRVSHILIREVDF